MRISKSSYGSQYRSVAETEKSENRNPLVLFATVAIAVTKRIRTGVVYQNHGGKKTSSIPCNSRNLLWDRFGAGMYKGTVCVD